MISDRDIERAGRAMKVLRVAGAPGMDEIAIKLHCSSLTYNEMTMARAWARALHLAESEPDLGMIDIAARIRETA